MGTIVKRYFYLSLLIPCLLLSEQMALKQKTQSQVLSNFITTTPFNKTLTQNIEGFTILVDTIKPSMVEQFVNRFFIDTNYAAIEIKDKVYMVYGYYKSKKDALEDIKLLHPRKIVTASVITISSVVQSKVTKHKKVQEVQVKETKVEKEKVQEMIDEIKLDEVEKKAITDTSSLDKKEFENKSSKKILKPSASGLEDLKKRLYFEELESKTKKDKANRYFLGLAFGIAYLNVEKKDQVDSVNLDKKADRKGDYKTLLLGYNYDTRNFFQFGIQNNTYEDVEYNNYLLSYNRKIPVYSFMPYVGIVGGWSTVKLNKKLIGMNIEDNSANVFTYGFNLGLEKKIKENIDIVLQYQYLKSPIINYLNSQNAEQSKLIRDHHQHLGIGLRYGF